MSSPLLRKLFKMENEAEKKASQPLNHTPAPATSTATDSLPEIESPMTLSDSETKMKKSKKNKERKKKKKKKKKAARDAGSSSHLPELESPMRLSDSERKKIKNKKNKERKKKKAAAKDGGSSSHLPELESPMTLSDSERKKIKNKKNKERKKKEAAALGTLAPMDQTAEQQNYNEVSVKKSADEPEMVKNFLLKTLHLQGQEKRFDNFTLGEGVLHASYKVSSDSLGGKKTIVAAFGGSAIGRVAPVDSGLLLRASTKCTCDHTLQ